MGKSGAAAGQSEAGDRQDTRVQDALEREEIAEIDYRPSKAQRTYRMVILRKTILVEKGQQRLLPQRRYHFYVTNIPAAELATAGVVRENNRRCNQDARH